MELVNMVSPYCRLFPVSFLAASLALGLGCRAREFHRSAVRATELNGQAPSSLPGVDLGIGRILLEPQLLHAWQELELLPAEAPGATAGKRNKAMALLRFQNECAAPQSGAELAAVVAGAADPDSAVELQILQAATGRACGTEAKPSFRLVEIWSELLPAPARARTILSVNDRPLVASASEGRALAKLSGGTAAARSEVKAVLRFEALPIARLARETTGASGRDARLLARAWIPAACVGASDFELAKVLRTRPAAVAGEVDLDIQVLRRSLGECAQGNSAEQIEKVFEVVELPAFESNVGTLRINSEIVDLRWQDRAPGTVPSPELALLKDSLRPVQVDELRAGLTADDDGSRYVQVLASALFENECLAPRSDAELTHSADGEESREEGRWLKQSLFAREDNRICPFISAPVTRWIEVARWPAASAPLIDGIELNGERFPLPRAQALAVLPQVASRILRPRQQVESVRFESLERRDGTDAAGNPRIEITGEAFFANGCDAPGNATELARAIEVAPERLRVAGARGIEIKVMREEGTKACAQAGVPVRKKVRVYAELFESEPAPGKIVVNGVPVESVIR